jgi:hypothetical protein
MTLSQQHWWEHQAFGIRPRVGSYVRLLHPFSRYPLPWKLMPISYLKSDAFLILLSFWRKERTFPPKLVLLYTSVHSTLLLLGIPWWCRHSALPRLCTYMPMYSKNNSTKSPASDASNVCEPRLASWKRARGSVFVRSRSCGGVFLVAAITWLI